jgi:hypothetical protein
MTLQDACTFFSLICQLSAGRLNFSICKSTSEQFLGAFFPKNSPVLHHLLHERGGGEGEVTRVWPILSYTKRR